MADEMDQYLLRLEQAESEINHLRDEIDILQDPAKLKVSGVVSPEVDKLQTENSKLKYQLNHLKRFVMEEQSKQRTGAISMQRMLEDVFRLAITSAFPQLDNPPVLLTPSAKTADYQCNSAMSLARQLGSVSGNKVNPREVADTIVSRLPETDFYEKVEVAGPGFINVYLSKPFVAREIQTTLTFGVRPPTFPQKKRVVIDFSSPNIAKEMHVGHLRSTIIGESISRLLEWVGHDVLRINHLGDWGTQFGMLIAHLQDRFPNFLSEKPPISDLQAFYKESKARFDVEEDFKKRAYQCVVQLQAYEPSHYKAWQMIYSISMSEFNKVYQRLQVTLTDRGESFYQERMKSLMKELIDKEAVEKDEEGRWVMFVPGFNVPLMMTKSDGGFTYDTSDMACIRQRLQEENADWVLYVVDSGQATHLTTVFEAARQLGWMDSSKHRVEHVGFGVVLGEDNRATEPSGGDRRRGGETREGKEGGEEGGGGGRGQEKRWREEGGRGGRREGTGEEGGRERREGTGEEVERGRRERGEEGGDRRGGDRRGGREGGRGGRGQEKRWREEGGRGGRREGTGEEGGREGGTEGEEGGDRRRGGERREGWGGGRISIVTETSMNVTVFESSLLFRNIGRGLILQGKRPPVLVAKGLEGLGWLFFSLPDVWFVGCIDGVFDQ
ncbi:hypothetical protein ACOMHN_014213 [Nucella lapillus]